MVSHGQILLVNKLLEDLATKCPPHLDVILTQNVPEAPPIVPRNWNHRLDIVSNERPAGFGANHNAAFRRCRTPAFCVVNPDIRLTLDPIPILLAPMRDERIALVGPKVSNPNGGVEDSARKFPTVSSLFGKALTRPLGPDYPVDRGTVEVDWIAGMFMLFRSRCFAEVGGFDERFFLYYEDVDICRRLRSKGYSVVFNPGATVIHDARRESRRNPMLMWVHATSALRYLLRKYPYIAGKR